MTGRTHVKAALLIYIILCVLPIVALTPFVGLTVFTVAAVVIGAVWPDGDTAKSKMNQYNPATRAVTASVDVITRLGINLIKFLFTFGIGIILLSNAGKISKSIDVPINFIYLFGGMLIILYFVKAKYLRIIPVLGLIYSKITEGILRIGDQIKYHLIRLVYIGLGFGIAIYNVHAENDTVVYLIAFFIGLTAVFPHRTFLHSFEGIILFSMSALYFGFYINKPEVGYAAILGYISHIFMGDVFTNSGITLFSIPYLLNQIKFIKGREKFSKALTQMTIRIRIPLMETNSDQGNRFENMYITVLVVIAIIAWSQKLKIPVIGG